jgi:molecular chaperone DnaJ
MDLREARTILGLTDTATKEEAKKAFRKLAAKHHPDKEGGNEDTFKKVNEAYQVIETGKDFGPTNQSAGQPRGWGGGGFQSIDIEDLIRQASGGGNPFNPRRRQQSVVEDKVINSSVTFKESIIGCQKDIKYRRKVKCVPCNGGGYTQINNGCKTCNGTGTITTMQGNMMMRRSCHTCGGHQKVESCKICNEYGCVDSETTMTVNIPGGVREGRDVLVLQGVGDYAGSVFGGDQYASIRLHLAIDKDPSMRVDNEDVITDCDISLLEALTGCSKTVSTIDGNRDITIPAKIKNKEEIIIPNLGVNRQGNERVIIQVQYPDSIDELIKTLEK